MAKCKRRLETASAVANPQSISGLARPPNIIEPRPMRVPDRVVLLLLVLLPFIVLAPAFAPGRVFAPAENLMGVFPWRALTSGSVTGNVELFDATHYFHPALIYAAEEVRAGRFPFWNPYQYAGSPFFSNPQSTMLFPLTALAYVLPVPLALALGSALKLAIAGAAMFWFLRVLGLGLVPAVTGALGFMLGSQMVTWLHWTFSNVIMLMPALFAAVERLRAAATAGRTATLAAIVALVLLAGYPQGSVHAALATGAWMLTRARGAAPGFLWCTTAAALLGAGMAAVQLLPFAEYVRESAVYSYRSSWTAPLHVPVESAVTFLMPYFYGLGPQRWGGWPVVIATVFVGTVPLLAVAWGVRDALKEPIARFFVGLAVLAGCIHYGAPVVGSLAEGPAMLLGTNGRLMPWLAFAVCTLGALGLERARADSGRLVRAWFAVVALLGLFCVVRNAEHPGVLSLTWPLSTQYVIALALLTVTAAALLAWIANRSARCGGAVIACQLVGLLPFAATYNPVRDSGWFYPTPAAIAWLQQRPEDRVVMPGHVGHVYHLRLAHGYDGMTPRRIEEIAGPVGDGNAGAAGFLQNPLALWGSEPLSAVAVLLSGVGDVLSIRYLVLPPKAQLPGPGLRVAYDGSDARILERVHALPRAFLATAARCVGDAEAIRLVRTRAVDFRSEVLLADCDTVEPGAPLTSADVVELRPSDANSVELSVTTSAPRYLVITDTWFPGWHATVSGVPTKVWRANHAFRAVRVPAGRHDVKLWFRPRSFQTGVVLSLGALAGILGLGLASVWRRDAAH